MEQHELADKIERKYMMPQKGTESLRLDIAILTTLVHEHEVVSRVVGVMEDAEA
jgi:hypothetical protein